MLSGRGLWSERKKATIKVRAKMLDAARSWFKKHDFVEVHGPVMVPALGDRPDSFRVEHFGADAYLTQGLEPYVEILMENLGRVYTVSPVFRAEKVRSERHLTEYWLMEAAIPHCDLDNLIKIQEQLVCHVCGSLSKEAREELRILGRSFRELESIKAPLKRLTYDEAIERLQQDGVDIQWGATLLWEHEEHLSLLFRQPFFVSEFPVGTENFFYESHPEKPELSLSVDLLTPEGYGEVSSGGQPTTDRETLQRKMEEANIESTAQEWYMNLRMGIPHSGFALGVERMTHWICKLDKMKEASAFPRSTNNVYP